jgi:hypothetical protein
VDTTEDFSVRLDAVADDTAITVWANRRQRMDSALEAIKGVAFSAHDDFKRLVIIVLANFAYRHTQIVRARGASRRCLIFGEAKISLDPSRCALRPRSPSRAEIFLVLIEAESYH